MQELRPDSSTHTAEPFGRIPYRIADAGGFAGLNGAESKVYLVLAVHVGRDWIARPSLDRVAKLAGIDRRTARRAVRALKDRRLVQLADAGGGRGRPATYRITTNPDAIAPLYPVNPDNAAPVSNTETRTDRCLKGGQSEPETRTDRCLKGGVVAPRTERTDRTEQQQSGVVAEIDGGEGGREADHADTLAALHRHGVQSPGAESILKELPGLTAGIVDEVLAKVGPTARGGLAVTLLREHAPDLIIREEVRKRARVQLRERLADLVREASTAYMQNCETFTGTLAGLDDDRLQELRADVCRELVGQLATMPKAGEVATKAAGDVVRDWLDSIDDQQPNPGFLVMMHGCLIARQQRDAAADQAARSAQRQADQQRQHVRAQADRKDQDRQRYRDAEAWFDQLDDAELVERFRELVNTSLNLVFRQKWEHTSPTPVEIRKGHKVAIIEARLAEQTPAALVAG